MCVPIWHLINYETELNLKACKNFLSKILANFQAFSYCKVSEAIIALILPLRNIHVKDYEYILTMEYFILKVLYLFSVNILTHFDYVRT